MFGTSVVRHPRLGILLGPRPQRSMTQGAVVVARAGHEAVAWIVLFFGAVLPPAFRSVVNGR
jgi:hypothetical protein